MEQVISLGAWCQTTWQLQRMGLRRAASPFDDTGSPMRALAAIIEAGGHGIADDVLAIDGGHTATCRTYGLILHHAFPRDAADKVILNARTLRRARQRMAFRWRILDAALATGRPTLFVRHGAMARAPYILAGERNEGPVAVDPLNLFMQAARRRWPDTPMRTLWLLDPLVATPVGVLDPAITHVAATTTLGVAGEAWHGCSSTWDWALGLAAADFEPLAAA